MPAARGEKTAARGVFRKAGAGGGPWCGGEKGLSVPQTPRALRQAARSLFRAGEGMLDDVYNRRILSLAANIPRLGRLEQPDGVAEAHARLCGSWVKVMLRVADGRVADFAHEVRACALGQASSSIMARGVIGADLEELRQLRDAMFAMLDQGAPPPGGKWAECALLEPVRAYRNRHASTMLTFEATLSAMRQALEKQDQERGARQPAP